MQTPENTSRLRRAIDSGETGDKVAFPDPAAAPLGTDEEAGGKPPTAAEVSLDRAGLGKPARNGRWGDQLGVPVYVGVAGAVSLVMLAVIALAR